VASYTIYLVDPSGRLRLGESLEEADDAVAITYFRAAEFRGETAVLWQCGRLIARRDAEGGFFLGAGS
jgi:hypothetical protein